MEKNKNKMEKIIIGIVGQGAIGTALKEGFEYLNIPVKTHDIKFETTINEVLSTDVCFICVPTPSKSSGECDTTIVKGVVTELLQHNYKGVIAVKSTVIPGTVESLIKDLNYERIAFVPEFLRERCATKDFIKNQDLLVIGTNSEEDYEIIKSIHKNLPKTVVKSTPTEAEFVKYFNNCYNATLITFANSLCTICDKMGVNYSNVKEMAVLRSHINDVYLNSSAEIKGFAGMCLPKDTKALDFLSKSLDLKVEFFGDLIKENEKFEKTVFKGMRL